MVKYYDKKLHSIVGPLLSMPIQKSYASIKRMSSVKYYSSGKSSDALEKLQTMTKKVEMPKVPVVGFSFSVDVRSYWRQLVRDSTNQNFDKFSIWLFINSTHQLLNQSLIRRIQQFFWSEIRPINYSTDQKFDKSAILLDRNSAYQWFYQSINQ